MSTKNSIITVLNRAGKEKTKFIFSAGDTVQDLKKHIASHTKLPIERQYLTVGAAPTPGSTAKRVVMEHDDKNLSEYPLSDNNFVVTLKDLGPQIGWRTVFLIEYAGPPILFLLNDILASALGYKLGHIQRLAIVLILIHYAKRELESIYVHIFSHGTMPLKNVFKNSLHYWIICGVMISTELFYFWKDPGYSVASSYVLAALFLVFEFLNLMCHITLRKLRTGGQKGGANQKSSHTARGIPYGWGFDLVSCANYLWEGCAWLVFAILTRTWTGYLFFGLSFMQMSLWALKKHKNYRKEFPNYPRGRRAIVPFVL